MINFNSLETFVISLRYNIKNLGPNIDPCGTPHEIFNVSDLVSLKYTYCCLLFKITFNPIQCLDNVVIYY